MCAMALCSVSSGELSSNRSVMTLLPVKEAMVRGVMNLVAAFVITACTACPSAWSARTNSADLYAAIPPVTPSKTVLWSPIDLTYASQYR